jgi:hypothetical protein
LIGGVEQWPNRSGIAGMDGREHLVGSRDGRMFGRSFFLLCGSLIFVPGFLGGRVFRVLPAADIKAEDSSEEQGSGQMAHGWNSFTLIEVLSEGSL